MSPNVRMLSICKQNNIYAQLLQEDDENTISHLLSLKLKQATSYMSKRQHGKEINLQT